MKKTKIKSKIIALLLVGIVAIGIYFPVKTASASGVPVIDAGNIAQSTISATENTLSAAYNAVTSYAENNMWIKEYVLDPLAWGVAKAMVQQIVDKTVNWINGGFNGSPSFVQNPEQFFQKIGDNIAGNFIAGPGSPLAALCSPIALNVRLALALNQAGSSKGSGASNPYTCTLSTVINNVKGATINGFEAGDFSQGGWAALPALPNHKTAFMGHIWNLNQISLRRRTNRLPQIKNS